MRTLKAAPKPIVGPLRARINQIAHGVAMQEEARIRAAMLAKVQAARDGGATYDELSALVESLGPVTAKAS